MRICSVTKQLLPDWSSFYSPHWSLDVMLWTIEPLPARARLKVPNAKRSVAYFCLTVGDVPTHVRFCMSLSAILPFNSAGRKTGKMNLKLLFRVLAPLRFEYESLNEMGELPLAVFAKTIVSYSRKRLVFLYQVCTPPPACNLTFFAIFRIVLVCCALGSRKKQAPFYVISFSVIFLSRQVEFVERPMLYNLT